MRQIAVIKPKVIVALGAVAAKTLLAINAPMSEFRGRWFDFRGTKLAVTYHPAFLLRDPRQKKETWKDLQMVMKELGMAIPAKGAEQIKHNLPQAVSIFIMPPDRKTLESRLRKRSLDAEEVIHRRLVTASREIENYEKYDYILINDRLDESIDALMAILLAERLRRSGVQGSANDAETLAKAESCRLCNIRERLQPIIASFATAVTSGGR